MKMIKNEKTGKICKNLLDVDTLAAIIGVRKEALQAEAENIMGSSDAADCFECAKELYWEKLEEAYKEYLEVWTDVLAEYTYYEEL